jgi:phospholipid/cholesterol/gamma-HCH transport system permease protein
MSETREQPVSPTIAVQGQGETRAIEGTLDVHTISRARQALGNWLNQRKGRVLDLGKLDGLDTCGALFLCELREKHVEFSGVRKGHVELLELIGGLERKRLQKLRAHARWQQFIVQIGKGADDFCRDVYAVVAFVARAVNAIAYTLVHPSRLRPASISRQILETGINALPIVGLMAVMIAVVIGYQGVAQLRPFGGEDYMINLVAVSVVREMGVLITAIMVAGRSGSAFTAEIGVMKAREEIDALEVMGLDRMELLVVPRLIGLVIALPLLTFFADVMGLFGGAISAHSLLQIEPPEYLDRVRAAIEDRDVFVGLVKAPIFAFFIGVVGCMHGLRVRGSAESVGRETTRAVVKGIFLVIIFDALFSVLFEKLGL